MSTKPSDVMMGLLQELALLKELDKEHESGARSEAEIAEFNSHQRRREEISAQIKGSRLARHPTIRRKDKPAEFWLPPRDSNPDSLLQRQVS
jgi:hypothetical protein